MYAVEWTHDDGMDQHQQFADLSPREADEVLALLERRGAVEVHVYEIMPVTRDTLVDEIDEDLPEEGDDAES